MAQDISLLGAIFEDVPAVLLPINGGGTARFTDTSDTTAAASDVASGKYFYTAQGVRTSGTGSGGATLITKSITQNGTYNASSDNADGYSSVTVNVSGGGAVESNDVNFYDYDGTILYSYSAADFANLSALPANPTHTGLTAQGWNWTLSDAKTYVATYGMLDIGQSYTTDDGKTRIYITIPAGSSRKTFYLRFSTTVAGAATIDWGDGNTSTNSGTSETTYYNDYENTGNYVVTIALSGTATATLDTTSTNLSLFRPTASGTTGNGSNYSQRWVTAVNVGNGFMVGGRTFENAYNLKYITLPNGSITSGKSYSFYMCNSLTHVCVPSGVTSIPGSYFYGCYSLESVCLPKSLTSIGDSAFRQSIINRVSLSNTISSIENNAFNQCCTLNRVTLSGITSVGNSAFGFDYCLSEIDTEQFSALPSSLFSYVPIKEIKIKSGVTVVGNNCFSSNRVCEKVILPSTITSIESSAFNGIIGDMWIYATTPPTLANTSALPSGNIYVPAGYVDTYKAASVWSTSSVANRIYEMPA